MKTRLNKTNVEAIKPPESTHTVVWDDQLPGYGIRVSAKGTKTFFIQKRTKAGREIAVTVGRFGQLAPDQARRIATGMLADIAAGKDPAQEIRESRRAEKKRMAAPTGAEMLDAYMDLAKKKKRRETTLDSYRRNIDLHLKPAFGSKKVAEITGDDVERFHASLADKPYQANRCLALLSVAFNKIALKRNWRSDNPVQHVERFKEYTHQRYLKTDEKIRLFEAMNESKSPAVDALKLALFTGARIGECLKAKWTDIDLKEQIWSKPPSSTKQKELHVVPLNPPALELLTTMEAKAKTQYLFPGMANAETPQQHYRHAWNRIVKKAGLEGFRVHDMRHHFASEGASVGLSLPMIGSLLGHSNSATTQKYAHLMRDPLKEATDKIGARLQRGENKTAEVVTFKEKRT